MDQTRKASMYTPEDFISSMPDNVITNILDRLPLQDAVRTVVLSRNWRFKWTTLSQLIFDEMFYAYLLKTKSLSIYGRIISQLLLHLNGAITKFVFYIDFKCYSVTDKDINHWILLLSVKGIEDLTICYVKGPRLKLPTHLFSCLELKHLNLIECCFDPPASFHGFPKLLSLDLGFVEFENGKFGGFFTKSPVLEILDITFSEESLDLAEIAKLANLKMLSFYLCNVDDTCSSSDIFELMGSLPKLQELRLDFLNCEITEDGAKRRLPTTFPCLKTLKLSTIELSDGIMLSCVFDMIRSLPNLHILEIEQDDYDLVPTPTACSPKVYSNTMELLQLQSVVISYCKVSENEVCLIKYLLACSPFLKKISIRLASLLNFREKFEFSKILLKLQRAFPVVDIDLCEL